MLAPNISKCWVLFLISALLSLALQKPDSFSEFHCKNVLCVVGFVVMILWQKHGENASHYVCHDT